MSNKINLSPENRDTLNDFEDSGSENEYTEHEKSVLNQIRKGRNKRDHIDKQNELFAFNDNDSSDANDDDEQDDNQNEDSDIEDKTNYDYDIPDARAWGNRRGAYFNTDFIDQDYSNYNPEEEEQAQQEEAEAKVIQQRLAQELDEIDFSLDLFATDQTSAAHQAATVQLSSDISSGNTTTTLKADLTGLSQRQKLQIFEKESPEFAALVQDFEKNAQDSMELLQPIIDYAKLKNIHNIPFFQFIDMKNKLSLNYMTHIAFYLLLKAKNIPIKNHPIIKRLFQMRQLQIQLNDKFEEIIKPQIHELLERLKCGEEFICTTNTNKSLISKSNRMDYVNGNNDDENEEEIEEDGDVDDDEQARRAINYQISKNKGLMPHRKKEMRNPRVKHRNKFRKALIRRKGAVRTVRTEVSRYSGEISGIKATGKKGIKIR